MPFPTGDRHWDGVRQYLEDQAPGLARVLAPNEFLEAFPGVCPYSVSDHLPPAAFAYVVIHKGMVQRFNTGFLADVLAHFHPVFADEVFVVLRPEASEDSGALRETDHVKALVELAGQWAEPAPAPPAAPRTALVVTTFDRPLSLARSLESLARLDAPMLVVDDGSSTDARRLNREAAAQMGAAYLAMPSNRGLCCAINTGVAYWLADPSIAWISVFTDDIEVRADLLTVFAAVQDARERPLLVGRLASEHPVFGEGTIAGHRVLYQRSSPGFPLHAHRNYWRDVLPIPTPYLGAPKRTGGRPGQGSEADWWIGSWAPRSITKRGGFIVCVPGLVRHTGDGPGASTWGNSSGGSGADAGR